MPEAKNFVSALVQADRLGLPIGNVLREQSHQMRLVRRQRAEEKAQKVPVKILFPMLLFIFPALFIVIIGPGAIRMIDTFSHSDGAGGGQRSMVGGGQRRWPTDSDFTRPSRSAAITADARLWAPSFS